MSLLRDLANLFNYSGVLLATRSRTDLTKAVPVTSDDPLPIVIIRDETGSAGSGGFALVPMSGDEARETIPLTNVAQGLTIPAGALAARISVRGGSASVAYATPAPTASTGDLWPDGSLWQLDQAEMGVFRAVLASGASALNVTYLEAAS